MFAFQEMQFLNFLVVFLFMGSSFATQEHPIVETPQGKLLGFTMTSRGGRKFKAFTKVPYAKPPVGNFRFRPPETYPGWKGVKNATEPQPMCIQYRKAGIEGVEDCLFLAIYTHNISRAVRVLVHFHGGGFVKGANIYNQPEFLMDEDIVIVGASFRIGIYGFLTFETPEYPGNHGLKDQVLVLQWVRENIASFGGNPNQVTIIGESSGGASVYHHLVSPLSKGLFQRAIAESGTSYALWAFTPTGEAKANAEKLMKLIGCPTSPKEGMECVITRDPHDVLQKYSSFIEWEVDPMSSFGPVLEGPGSDSFLVGPISEWVHEPVPLLLGATSAEGLIRTLHFLEDKIDFNWLSDNFNRLAPMSLMYRSTSSNPDQVTKQIREFFLPNEKITLNDWVNLTTVYGDLWFLIPAVEGANKHTGNVFFYYFDYVTKAPEYPKEFQKFIYGANHVLESHFIWNVTNIYPFSLDSDDVQLSKSLIKAIVKFMDNGVPEIEGSSFTWKPWTPENNFYAHIDRRGYHLEKGLVEDRQKLWKKINYKDKLYKPRLK